MTDELTLCYNKLLPQGRKFTKIDYLYKNLQGRSAKFNTNLKMFFNNITEDLRNKRKLVIPSQSKEQLKDIFIKLQELDKLENLNLKIIMLTSDTTELYNIENKYNKNDKKYSSDDIREDILNDLNYYCNNSDVVMYTSTITSGISFNDD